MANIIFIADLLLFSLAFLWLIAASITDLRKREVANWLSFSLISIAFAIRIIVAIIEKQSSYFLYALIAFAIFFVLANLFYYARIFGGGDTKLLVALSVVFSTNPTFIENLSLIQNTLNLTGIHEPFLLVFLINIFVLGSLQGLAFSAYSAVKNKKFIIEFKKTTKKIKFFILVCWILAFLCLLISFFDYNWLFSYFIIFLILPFLYSFIKASENSALVKKITSDKLTEGDWIVKSIKINNKIIKPSVHGLSKEEIKLLKKHKKQVTVLYGLPFVPVFLLALICSLFFGNLLFLLMQFLLGI